MQSEKLTKLTKDIALLNQGILKWERLANNKDNEEDNCPLCYEYNKRSANSVSYCDGCPIKENTGQQCCNGSPYEAWLNYSTITIGAKYESKGKQLAKNMSEYLQELLADHLFQLAGIYDVPPNIPSTTTAVHVQNSRTD
jgi:hypothetical protein